MVTLGAQDSINTLKFNRLFFDRLPSPFTARASKTFQRRSTMSHYHQREIKDLYRPKDVILTIVGVVITMTIAVVVARLFTGYAGF